MSLHFYSAKYDNTEIFRCSTGYFERHFCGKYFHVLCHLYSFIYLLTRLPHQPPWTLIPTLCILACHRACNILHHRCDSQLDRKHEVMYGLRICSSNASRKLTEFCWLFCVTFGREESFNGGRVSKIPRHVRVTHTFSMLRTDYYLNRLCAFHSMKWEMFSELSATKKSEFLRRISLFGEEIRFFTVQKRCLFINTVSEQYG